MKLLFIRHGDPDYTIDSLTEKGWKEAEFLSEKIAALDVRDFYVSPLGRAKDTASCTLKKNGRTATECKWLREFDVKIRRPDLHGEKIIPWDWLPQDWTKIENFYIPRSVSNTQIVHLYTYFVCMFIFHKRTTGFCAKKMWDVPHLISNFE